MIPPHCCTAKTNSRSKNFIVFLRSPSHSFSPNSRRVVNDCALAPILFTSAPRLLETENFLRLSGNAIYSRQLPIAPPWLGQEDGRQSRQWLQSEFVLSDLKIHHEKRFSSSLPFGHPAGYAIQELDHVKCNLLLGARNYRFKKQRERGEKSRFTEEQDEESPPRPLVWHIFRKGAE